MRYLIFGMVYFLIATFSFGMEVRPSRPKPIENTSEIPKVKEKKKPWIMQTLQAIKKELHPMLSRGLVMSIMGAVLVALGILFYPLFDTVILTVIFGIVCIIGLITLILYFANPKLR